jgi:hypothetical protein
MIDFFKLIGGKIYSNIHSLLALFRFIKCKGGIVTISHVPNGYKTWCTTAIICVGCGKVFYKYIHYDQIQFNNDISLFKDMMIKKQ